MNTVACFRGTCALLSCVALLLPAIAQATPSDSCVPAAKLVEQANEAVIQGRFSDMPSLVASFDSALSCGPAIQPGTLAAFFRAQGAWYALTERPTESDFAFQSAALLAPDAWTPAFGSALQEAFSQAATRDPGPSSRLRLDPPDPALDLHLDGSFANSPVSVHPGLHAVQLLRPNDADLRPGEARFGRVVAVFPGEDVVVNPGLLPPERAPVSAVQTPRPTWALGAGGTALVVSGVTAAMARRQASAAGEAASLAELDRLEQRQKALAWTSYSSFGLGVVGGALYFSL